MILSKYLSSLFSISNGDRKNISKEYCKTIIKPTLEETKQHSDFLKKELKKNYY
jgi:hypothetical protein